MATMPLPRKPLFVNENESRTDRQLRQLETTRPARVAAKVRIADVLRIDQSGLSNEEYGYALKAHFDNVMYDNTRVEQPEPLFAVEFDGGSHAEPTAQRRDTLKDSICNRFSFPILRIDADFLIEREQRITLLTWLSDLWFEYQEFEQAQRRGDVPIEASFRYDYLYLDPAGGYDSILDRVAKRRLSGFLDDSEDEGDEADDDLEEDNEAFAFRPFALASAERRSLGTAQNAGMILGRGELLFGSVAGRTAACLSFKVDDGYIVGKATCKPFNFPPIRDLDVVEELATRDADVKFARWLCGQGAPLAQADMDRIREQIENRVENPEAGHGPICVKTAFGFTTLAKMFEVAEREISRSLGVRPVTLPRHPLDPQQP